MKNKIKKLLISTLLIFSLFMITGCSIFDNLKRTIVNEIRNEYVEYDQNITVDDIEEALQKGSEIAKSCTIGVKIEAKNFISTTNASGSAVIIKKVENSDKTYTYTAITNHHVTGTLTSTERKVYLGNSVYVPATLVAYDDDYDLAILQFTTVFLLNVATIYTETPKVGSFAIAVGSPYDLEGFYNTVTIGAISEVNRKYLDEDINGNEVVNSFIQHDAAINSGNSGGGLFDIYGRLIGINTWKISSNFNNDFVGLNFAIPSSEIINSFSKLIFRFNASQQNPRD